MPERACDLCGWPIEEWQKAEIIEESTSITDGSTELLIGHANPADHRPTRRLEPETPSLPRGAYRCDTGVGHMIYRDESTCICGEMKNEFVH